MKIGIYLGYPPRVTVAAQGLGRYLQHLVKGLVHNDSVSIVILTPSWLRADLPAFLADHGIETDRITFLAPARMPIAVRLFELIDGWKNSRSRGGGLIQRCLGLLRAGGARVRSLVVAYVSRVLTSRSVVGFVIRALPGVALAPLLLVIALAWLVSRTIVRLVLSAARRVRSSRVAGLFSELVPASRHPFISALSERIKQEESRLMIALANREQCDVWYSPTAFWPEVNQLRGHVVICVPDLSPSEFPVHYAIKHPQMADTVERIVETVRGGSHFITYGERVAQQTLIQQLGVSPERVFIIPHAPNRLDHLIEVSGTPDPAQARRRFATSMIEAHRARCFQHDEYRRSFSLSDTRYIFYPTQIRPNKNIQNLLLAYETLLRKQYRHVKLFLTGSIRDNGEISDFINTRRLTYDVFDFQEVSDQVLAALYHRADLVVNASLFEGGFPFTFSEGLSVGTPSVQADLPEVRRVVGDDLGDAMLFDPYDPTHIAEVIGRGLDQRQVLLDRQLQVLERFENRTWDMVADRHIGVFRQVCALPRTK